MLLIIQNKKNKNIYTLNKLKMFDFSNLGKIDKKTVFFIILIFIILLFLFNVSENMSHIVSDDKPVYLSDTVNKYIWGTTLEEHARRDNMSLRPEYQGDLKDGTYKTGSEGHDHVCPCGPPSKRTMDAYGGHHQLQHMCEPCVSDQYEPVQLGTWWTREGCGDPSSVGLSQRPYCTDC